MKITQWLGFNEESSQYLLRRGELRALINLHPRRPGMLVTRQGLIKLYGKYNDERIVGLYRRDTLFGEQGDFLCFQKIIVERELTIAQIEAKEFPQEFVWMVRRIQGNQERVIHQLPISPDGISSVHNFSVSEDRHGRLFLFFGHGATPMMYRPGSLGNVAVEIGLPAPLVAPVVEPSGEGYFLEAIDVVSGGGSYWAPPTIAINGGSPDRAARVKGVVQGGNLVSVRVIDGGANYKSFPNVVVGSDKIGSGFRAVGLLETDPGVQGFADNVAGAVTGTAPVATETVGSNNNLAGNKIMYLSSPVTASTRTVGQPAATPTTSMVLQSVTGIGLGDICTVYSGTIPAAFTSTAVLRVIAIDETTKTVTLSKSWTPAVNVSYLVQFRKDTAIGYADASWDAATKRFTAAVPLRTTKGVGNGAEATLTISPMAYSYGIGAFSLTGYTTPSSAIFAYKETGWDNYINDEYWQGSFQNKADSKENGTYAGLQASGSTFVYGYSGTIATKTKGRSNSRRADVYWPDYSAISVWVCQGSPGGAITQYVRQDAKVYEDVPGQPYALVTLAPAAKQVTTVKTGRKTSRTVTVPYQTTDDTRPPVIRINLRPCPDSWVTNDSVNGVFNKPTAVKEASNDRQKWWHSSAKTPRPIVDLRGSAARIDAATVEVVDPGAGYERGTTFSIRIHQANAYDQKVDYNVAVTEPRLAWGHAPFSTTSRFVEFVFKATVPDNLTPAGPPNLFAGGQYVDVSGAGYRSGDTAAVTLLRRDINATIETPIASFDGVMQAAGQATEFTYSNGEQVGGAHLLNLTSATHAQVQVGNVVRCETADVLLDYSRVLSVSGGDIYLDKMRNPVANAAATISATVSSSGSLSVGATTSPFYVVGQRLYDTQSLQICTITSVVTSGGNTTLFVTGPFAVGSRTYRPVLRYSVVAGVRPAQTVTWTAEQVIAGTGEQRVTSVRILSGGRNYFSPPSILVRGGGNGYGLAVKPIVENGKVTSVEILDPGRAYTAQPELYTDSSAAVATPVMRPTMRGIYRCAYRFVDRSETVVASTSITGVRGDTPTTITVASAAGIEAGMLLESPRLPSGTRVVSVNGATVEINQEATGSGKIAAIVVENPGSGYGQDESITCTISGAAGYAVGVTKRANGSGSYSVNDATVTTQGTTLFPVGKVPVTFSSPVNGGDPATGYAYITSFDPSESYDKSVTVRDTSKPVSYSDFSPIFDADAGPNESRQHASVFRWAIPGVTPPTRADRVELWRTSGDESLVFYRVEAYGIPSTSGVQIVGTDTLSDEELFDPDRPNYAAMPIVLPNGSLNAYRFGQPRKDMAVGVAFQDRLWYGVSTSGKDTNTLFYSEFDEFESCPDVNDLPIQQNQRSTDSITALVPFGSMLLAMQHAHTYAITYNTDPGIDASIQMMSHRGCLHQRCWDIHENVIYAADEQGIYALSRSGEVVPISAPIRDYFNSELIDFSKRETFFLTVCPRTGVLRFFCCMVSQPEDAPTMALCYDIERQTWWTERYPNSVCSAVAGRPGSARINSSILGCVDGNMYELSPDKDHTNHAVMYCDIRNGGSGYRRSPKIRCPNSKGVQLKGVVSEGRLVDVLVWASGWDCKQGVTLEFPDSGIWKAIAGHDGKIIQGVEYAPIQLEIDPPEPGGEQAVAVAHFSVTTRLARNVTVSAGEDFVRLNSRPVNPIDFTEPPLIAAEDGDILASNGGILEGVPLQTEIPPVEIGMEAIGDFLPLNAFVSKIVGQNIYLEHPDGTPVTTLGGEPRNDPNQPLYPVRIMHAGGILIFSDSNAVSPTYPATSGNLSLPGDPSGDLAVMTTITTPGESATVDVQEAVNAYIAAHPGVTLTYASVEVVMVDAANRLVGWARTSSSNFPGTTNGTGGTNMVVSPMSFVTTTEEWLTGGLNLPGSNIQAIKPLEPFKVLTGLVPNIFPPPEVVVGGGTETVVYFRKPHFSHIPFRLATGALQIINEDNVQKGGDSLIDKSITLLYTPTEHDKEVEIIEFFNDSQTPRPNVMRRDRGGPGSFQHRQDSASTVLNTSRTASHLGDATGVATATFASRVYTDATAEDQHVQVELYSRPGSANTANDKIPQKFVLHSMTVQGVVDAE